MGDGGGARDAVGEARERQEKKGNDRGGGGGGGREAVMGRNAKSGRRRSS